LVERLTIDGEVRRMDIAVFFEVRHGKIAEGKVYREGSADLAE
jgi:ketosteroid isomerase-like protein